jgi:hypothetical protein
MTSLPNTDYNLINVKKKTTTTKSGSNVKITTTENVSIDELIESEKSQQQIEDSIQGSISKEKIKKKEKYDKMFNFGFESQKELDSMQKFGPEEDRLDAVGYWFIKKALEVKKNNTSEELIEKFKESFVHNFSKTLFVYMPLFAFFLWLFHSKKRWYYFDHGIFTLHYFSFLLLVTLVVFLFSKFLSLFGSSMIADTLKEIVDFVSILWMFYYFFPAHHRFYGESRGVSFIKSIALFVINMIFIIIIITLFALYTFINIK